MLGRARPLWILSLLSALGGLLFIIAMMQFSEVMPWAGAEATFIGGPWTGALLYAVGALLMFAAAYGWLTIRRWASMITIFAALIGLFIPFISYMDGTDPRSSAMGPVVIGVLMLIMVLRPATNRAMAEALEPREKKVQEKQTAKPSKPLSAARKRELADEQARAIREQVTSTPAINAGAATSTMQSSVTSTTATMAANATAAAATVVSQAVSVLPKPAQTAPVRPGVANIAKSAAALVGVSSRAPVKATATPKQAAPAASAPAPTSTARPPGSGQRPKGFRADEV